MAHAGLDAMLFAAGLGTRLGELTSHTPKALVSIAGVPMLERVAHRVIEAGADRLIINTHHHADQVEAFVRERGGFGVDVRLSHEPAEPLETGGGLKAAAPHFRGDRPVLVHNTDVITDFPLAGMLADHAASGALATLAVNERKSSRTLLFDADGLCGHEDHRIGARTMARTPRGPTDTLAFCGVHIVAPELPGRLTESGVFSIIESYLRLAGEGARIVPHRIDGHRWLDIGTPERLAEAERALAE